MPESLVSAETTALVATAPADTDSRPDCCHAQSSFGNRVWLHGLTAISFLQRRLSSLSPCLTELRCEMSHPHRVSTLNLAPYHPPPPSRHPFHPDPLPLPYSSLLTYSDSYFAHLAPYQPLVPSQQHLHHRFYSPQTYCLWEEVVQKRSQREWFGRGVWCRSARRWRIGLRLGLGILVIHSPGGESVSTRSAKR
jgi:hypothetical protein